MTPPLLTHASAALRYDRERGQVLLLDWRALPQGLAFLECPDVDALTRALEALPAYAGAPLAGAAGYGLALAARAWATRPSDARRGALIQAAEALRALHARAPGLADLLDAALARADAAIMTGSSAEEAVLGLVERELARADRVAERCGRLAAGLLDQEDRVLTHGFAGPALLWMLQVALAEQGKPVQLSLPAADTMAQITAQQAQVLGAHAALTEDAALALDEASVCVIAAARVACDGAALGAPGAGQRAALARQRGLPVYALGYAGPDPALASAADLLPPDAPAGAEADILPPDLLGAIVTSRGVYRPAMVARHLRDGDAPLDVIRLG